MKIVEIQKRLAQKWDRAFSEEHSQIVRLGVIASIWSVGFIVVACLNEITGTYFSAAILITVILIGLYGGFISGIICAVLLSLITDYFFLPPVGSVLNTPQSFEHFFIICILNLLGSCIGSSLRFTYRRTMMARKDAERARQEAEKSAILMEKVLALVSHDVRNPLTSIKAAAQLVLRFPEDIEKHQPLLARMLTSIDRIDLMIQSLLDVASIRAGKTIKLQFQYCDLRNEVSQMLEELSLIYSDRIKFFSSESAWGDWGLNGIRRALENLVTNAVKYGRSDTPITVSLELDGNQCILSVHNQGKEIPIEEQGTLFDSFQRSHETEKGSTLGWGLGLALVKGVAEAHGGSVQIESAREKGTTFSIRLPIQKAA